MKDSEALSTGVNTETELPRLPRGQISGSGHRRGIRARLGGSTEAGVQPQGPVATLICPLAAAMMPS